MIVWIAFLIPYLMIGAVFTATVLTFEKDVKIYSRRWWVLLILGTAFWGLGILYLMTKKLWEWVGIKIRARLS